jgi:hypothetical protein
MVVDGWFLQVVSGGGKRRGHYRPSACSASLRNEREWADGGAGLLWLWVGLCDPTPLLTGVAELRPPSPSGPFTSCPRCAGVGTRLILRTAFGCGCNSGRLHVLSRAKKSRIWVPVGRDLEAHPTKGLLGASPHLIRRNATQRNATQHRTGGSSTACCSTGTGDRANELCPSENQR